ncbi:CHC2 zinc finger domain-containing protein [Sulfuricurvum sp.]|uniref:CHC2 zinc finger domain-containing protein n=1 Tax=Sulfuricurvum sp. TaxID=2025608 RepID=UPI002602378C|nr:CHC2 zinc finger domain-containing protein [Sulfuricurvum sp.]MDD2267628.1 CHC2 zinc finger domain-containing protein [Sulfuricurvum sp.]MDD2784238.1 CHC2 zinc finger domain-containing protein [Sulfuricurvum sp.]
MAQSGGSERRDVFELARGVDFVPYAEAFLGVEFTDIRAPKCLCPWHEDKHPSFSVDLRKNKGKCFSCGEGGTIIDFTAKLTGKTPLQAATKIVEDLGL